METNPILAQSGNPNYTNPETYGFVSTNDLVSHFTSKGWELHKTQIASARKEERQGYQKHLLSFTHPELSNAPGMRPEHAGKLTLNLLNSHDGTSALRLGIGFYRIACLNGLLLGSELSSFRVIHSQRFIKDLQERAEQAIAAMPSALERMQRLQDITLTSDQYTTLAYNAASERLKSLGPKVGQIDLPQVLRAQRYDDKNQDAFTVLNRIQERLIRGGISYQRLEAQNHNGMVQYVHAGYRTTAPLRSVSESVRLNKYIFDRTMELAAS